ncbi:MAG: 3-deoxy-manno-octulosonate cytidylyltransferase [Halomonadaceae bacterium]|nr:MAG: 3-deoxy-manno-octulosonate cytidylyltransferase [Halomonadaceae bacterium]
MAFTVVIPARYASTRLPGKPLQLIAGEPMIRHVYDRARESDAQQVIIATDDERIRDVAEGFGAQVCMTSRDHVSGTDRLEEVVRLAGLGDEQLLVNVQGDEPLMAPALINQVAGRLLADPAVAMATLCEPITDYQTLFNPNVVKLVRDHQGHALYFSRAPIPWHRDGFAIDCPWQKTGPLPADTACFRHIGLYAYRASLLRQFVQWPPAPLELIESLEQLRVLHQGVAIDVAIACETPQGGVDTAADLERVRHLLERTHD